MGKDIERNHPFVIWYFQTSIIADGVAPLVVMVPTHMDKDTHEKMRKLISKPEMREAVSSILKNELTRSITIATQKIFGGE